MYTGRPFWHHRLRIMVTPRRQQKRFCQLYNYFSLAVLFQVKKTLAEFQDQDLAQLLPYFFRNVMNIPQEIVS